MWFMAFISYSFEYNIYDNDHVERVYYTFSQLIGTSIIRFGQMFGLTKYISRFWLLLQKTSKSWDTKCKRSILVPIVSLSISFSLSFSLENNRKLQRWCADFFPHKMIFNIHFFFMVTHISCKLHKEEEEEKNQMPDYNKQKHGQYCPRINFQHFTNAHKLFP